MKTIYKLCLILAFQFISTFASAAGATAQSIDTVPLTVLPVRWLEFTAMNTSKGVVLRWSTLHEQGIQQFIIERSVNNMDFESIGTTAAAGNSTSFEEYSFTDHSMGPGNNYYRVISIDENDYKTISIIRKVNNADHKPSYPVEILNIYASGKMLRVDAAFRHRQSAELTFFTRGGRRIFSKIIQSNSNCIAIDQLKPGLYYVTTGYQTFGIVLAN